MTDDVTDDGIDQIRSGRWRARVQVAGRRHTILADSPEEARELRAAMIDELVDEDVVFVDGASLKQLGPRFLASRSGNRTVGDDEKRWHRHLARAPFAHRACDAVTRRDVLEWLDALRRTPAVRIGAEKKERRIGKTLSWQTRKHLLNLLRSFFSWAMDREYARANPCIGVEVKKVDGDEDEGYQDGWYLTAAEQADLLERAKVAGGDESDLLAFALGTGLRLGELLAMPVANVHVAGTTPHVLVQFGSWDAKRRRYRTPKGRAGEKRARRVPLFGLALEAAKRQVARVPAGGLFAPSKRGGRRTKPPAWFTTLVREYTIPRLGRPIWWHLLRHTCASSLVAGWWGRRWSLEDVCKFLGHSSVKVTERYAHLVDSTASEVATQAQAAWSHRGHKLKSAPKSHETVGLLSRGSYVRVVPGVPQQNPVLTAAEKIGRDHGVTTKAIAVLEAVADGHPVDRLAVDLAETVLDLADEHADAGGDEAKAGGES